MLAVHLEPTQLSPGLELALSDRQAILQHDLTGSPYYPFATLSGSAEMGQLSQGITTQMIHALAPITSFSILPYRTIENFSDRTMSLDEIARALNVRYLLDGRIQHSGDKIRIGIELIDGILGKSLWQESKTFADTDLLTIQDEVTQLTSRILSSRMDAIEMQRLVGMPREDMDANELFRVSANFWLDPNQGNLETSINDLRRALALDPKHAGSMASLVHQVAMNIRVGGEKDNENARDEACRMASRAVCRAEMKPRTS